MDINPDNANSKGNMNVSEAEDEMLKRYRRQGIAGRGLMLFLEGLAYLATVVLVFAGLWTWIKLDNIIDFIQAADDLKDRFFRKSGVGPDTIDLLSFILILLLLAPSLFSYVMARLLTVNRRQRSLLKRISERMETPKAKDGYTDL